MKVVLFVSLALFAGPCSSASNTSTSIDPPTPGAPPTAAATVVPTSAAIATTTAGAPRAALATGPCALLEMKCRRCPPGSVTQTACNGALTAGAVDPVACTNALNDKDIKRLCGGDTPAPTPPPPPTVTQPAPSPAPPGAGPCAELAKKCPKCPAGLVSQACNTALAAGSLDPASCVNALHDHDIQRLCN
jgi:hypothetical protein